MSRPNDNPGAFLDWITELVHRRKSIDGPNNRLMETFNTFITSFNQFTEADRTAWPNGKNVTGEVEKVIQETSWSLHSLLAELRRAILGPARFLSPHEVNKATDLSEIEQAWSFWRHTYVPAWNWGARLRSA